jgi:hypothetical protein
MRMPVLLCLLATLVSACSGDTAPPGQIKVKNDSRDREYNVISVSGGGASASLAPGQFLILPKGTRSFSVERRYEKFTRYYSVSCPPLKGDGIVVKLIDIHVNRIRGGCKTTNASMR